MDPVSNENTGYQAPPRLWVHCFPDTWVRKTDFLHLTYTQTNQKGVGLRVGGGDGWVGGNGEGKMEATVLEQQ